MASKATRTPDWYLQPHDFTADIDRLTTNHLGFKQGASGSLIFAPIDFSVPRNVLDVATADGHWIRDVLSSIPLPSQDAHAFTGTDINESFFPKNPPKSTTFVKKDIHARHDDSWNDYFDLVQMRMVLMAAKIPPQMIVNHMATTPTTWLITGCSSGLGYSFAEQALLRGDRVIATVRGDVSRLSALKDAGASTYSLHVTAPLEDITHAVNTIVADVGKVDVLVNNAGYIEAGTVEAAGDTYFRKSFETNFFGIVKVTQSFLPHFRDEKSGCIAFISSLGGWNGQPCAGPYCSAKFALEGLHECLRGEVADLGIRSIIFDLRYFQTKMWHPDNRKWDSPSIPAYAGVRNAVKEYTDFNHDKLPGNPVKGVNLMMDVIKGEGVAAGKDFPERLPVGADAIKDVKDKCERTLQLINVCEHQVTDVNL